MATTTKITRLTHDQVEVAKEAGAATTASTATFATTSDEAIAAVVGAKDAAQAAKRAKGFKAMTPQYDAVIRKLRKATPVEATPEHGATTTPSKREVTPLPKAKDVGKAIIDGLNGNLAPLEAIVEQVAPKSALASLEDAGVAQSVKAKPVTAKKPAPKEAPVEAPPAKAPKGSVDLGGLAKKLEHLAAAVTAAFERSGGLKSHVDQGRFLVVASGEAQRVVEAITVHMREIIKENRGANMHTEGKLRQVRSLVIAAHPGTTVPGRASSAKPGASKGKAASKAESVKAATDEHRAVKAWEKAGRKGDRPATPALDAMNAAVGGEAAKAS